MYFFFLFLSATARPPLPPALYSCSASVMRNLADLISLVALLPRLGAGAGGGWVGGLMFLPCLQVTALLFS